MPSVDGLSANHRSSNANDNKPLNVVSVVIVALTVLLIMSLKISGWNL